MYYSVYKRYIYMPLLIISSAAGSLKSAALTAATSRLFSFFGLSNWSQSLNRLCLFSTHLPLIQFAFYLFAICQF
jgi:hypothetical protein